MPNISIKGGSSLESAIDKALGGVELQVLYATKDAGKIAANKTVKDLRSLSPKRKGGYSRSWKVKNEGYDYIVYNSKYPGLTQLLEKGHDIVSHGQKVGYKEGTPHISTAESLGEYYFEKEVEANVKRRLGS